MELLYFFLAAFVAVTANTVFSQDIITPSQEGQLRAGYATNLDTKYENNTGWRLPRYHTPKWFEYYNNTSHLNDMKENTTVCSSINQDFTTLSEKEGIWVACQDTDLPDDCSNTPSSPCHPILTYNTGIPGATVGLRTLKLTFALYGLATLRLSFGTLYNCFDFSKRSDPFSLCEYYEVDDSMETDGWTFVQFTFEPFSNVSFNTFSLQMISRFAKDVVLIDKIEATDVLLCGTVPCPTTTSTPRTTVSTNATTTITTTTEDDGITDPDFWTTTTKRTSSSTRLISCLAFNLLTFIILFHTSINYFM